MCVRYRIAPRAPHLTSYASAACWCQLNQVYFGYDPKRPLLENLNLYIDTDSRVGSK